MDMVLKLHQNKPLATLVLNGSRGKLLQASQQLEQELFQTIE